MSDHLILSQSVKMGIIFGLTTIFPVTRIYLNGWKSKYNKDKEYLEGIVDSESNLTNSELKEIVIKNYKE